MVKFCTEAHRAGARDLLWMSWLPKKAGRATHPRWYSGLIALTSEGARKLMLNFDDWFPQPGYWDSTLRYMLSMNPAMRAELSAGYLYPCLGHFTEHENAVDKGVRQPDWSMKHMIQETRTSAKLTAGHYSIGVCSFTEKGTISYLHPGMTLPDIPPEEDFRWWTAAITVSELPAGAAPTAEPRRNQGAQARKQGKWVPKNLHVRDTVTVDGEKDDQQSSQPIEITALQIMDETEELSADGSKSMERRWRAATALFRRRCFTNDPLKVAAWENYTVELPAMRPPDFLSFQPCELL